MSSSSSSSDSEEEQQTKSTTKPMKGLLNDDSDSDNDELLQPSLKINTKFAKEYETKKRREEFTKHRHLSSHANNSDDDSDDMAEIIDMLSDEFNADQLRALEFVLSRAKDRREKTSDYISRMHHGDPYTAMHNLVTGE